MELKGSKTEANLMAAFAGESQARNKYTFYAAKARKEGYQQIADLFDETANNERAHAEIWFKQLHGGDLPTTLTNLEDGAGGEHFEWTEMYPEFVRVAKEEGFADIAAKMELVAKIEKEHEERYRQLFANVKDNKVFQKDGQIVWICQNCGHIHVGTAAPQICPVCQHQQGFFEQKADNYR